MNMHVEKVKWEFFWVFGIMVVVCGAFFVFVGSGYGGETITAAAVLDLEAKEGVSAGLVSTISDYLRTQLVNTKRFDMYTRENMESILKEQQFQLSGCTSQECIVQIGQLLGVRKMFTGSIGKIGTIFLVNLKIIDVQSGRIEKAESSEEARSEEELLGSIRRLAKILAGLSVPPVERAAPGPLPSEERPYVPPSFVAAPAPYRPPPPSVPEPFFIDIFVGVYDMTTMGLEFYNSKTNIYRSHLGITGGTFSEPFRSIAWEDLKTVQTIPFGIRFGQLFSGGFSPYIEFFYSNYAIAKQIAPYFKVNTVKQGTFTFNTDDYFKVSTLNLGFGVIPFIPLAGFSNLYFGAGLNLDLVFYEASSVKGYVHEYFGDVTNSFATPSKDITIGLGFSGCVGTHIYFTEGFGIVVEGRYNWNWFEFTRGIASESDEVNLSGFQLQCGMSFMMK